MKKKTKSKSHNLSGWKNSGLRQDGWINPITGLGIGGRDKTVSGFFGTCWNFSNWPELDALYRSDGMARRVIDVVAAEMVRQGWEIETPDGEMINEAIIDLNGMCMLTDLVKWSRLYGGAIIVMGINDGLPLDYPVDVNNIRSINWLRVYDRFQTFIQFDSYNCDLNSKNYGNPDFYEINEYRTAQTFTVHHSRVLRMDWALIPSREKEINQGWGDSVLQSTYEQLRNYGTTFANVALIMQDFVNGVLKIPDLSQYLASNACGRDDIQQRLNYANITKSTLGMLVLDGGEDFEKLTTNVSGIPEIIDRFMLALSAVTGIPATLLFGRSPAGFNATGESDIRNFYDLIKQYQESKLRPCLERLIRYIMVSKEGPTKGRIPPKWTLKFTPLWQNSEEQEANIRRIVAETDAIYIDRGVLDPDEVAISRYGAGQWSMQTQIDLEARKNGFEPEETADLMLKKEKQLLTEQDVTIGPDSLNGGSDNIIINT